MHDFNIILLESGRFAEPAQKTPRMRDGQGLLRTKSNQRATRPILVGALAVIGTLIYLARQISQSGINSRASQISMLNQSYAALNDLIVGSPHAISALKSVENPKRGSSDEAGVLLRHLMYKWFNLWVAAQMAFSNGQLSEAEFEIYKDIVRQASCRLRFDAQRTRLPIIQGWFRLIRRTRRGNLDTWAARHAWAVRSLNS